MALDHSPQIATNGLVFYYDMANTQKSWKGRPTSNLISTVPLSLQTYAYASGPVVTASTRLNQESANVNRYTITSAVNVARAMIVPALTVGQSYSFSCYIRYNGSNTTTPSFVCDASKGNPEASGSNTLTATSITQTLIGQGWYYLVYKFTASASPTGFAILTYGVSTGADTTYVGNTFDVYNEMFEEGLTSPYVSGTRSNTQALLDLLGNNTITATSLTYNVDGSFSFDGTSNVLYFPYTQSSPNNFTVESWIYHTIHSPDTNIGHQIVIPYGGYNGWIFSLVGPDSKLQLRHHNFNTSDTSYNVAYSTGLSLNTWYHVAATDNGSTVSLYVNGTSVISASSATSTTNGTMAAYVGAWNGIGNTYFSGKIPAVRIYNRSLSPSEVRQNFNAQRGRYGI